MRITILDDDLKQLEFIDETLRQAGHVCHPFSEGQDFVRHLRRQTFDLLMLDRNVPDISGDSVLRWVRRNLSAEIPVLFTTRPCHEREIVSMLDSGADDYLVKPVSARLLLARVEAMLRRAYRQPAAVTRETFGQHIFDLSVKQVELRGKSIPLTQKEFDLALFFFRNLARPLSRSHILEVVWKQDVDLFSRTMDTHVSLIRSKLELRPPNGYALTPIYSYGYRLEKVEVEAA
jgi:DNA-binding response OmpR family regulator